MTLNFLKVPLMLELVTLLVGVRPNPAREDCSSERTPCSSDEVYLFMSARLWSSRRWQAQSLASSLPDVFCLACREHVPIIGQLRPTINVETSHRRFSFKTVKVTTPP